MRLPLPSVKYIPKYRIPVLATTIRVAAPHTSSKRMQLLEKELRAKLTVEIPIADWATAALKEGWYSEYELGRVGEEFMGGGLVKMIKAA